MDEVEVELLVNGRRYRALVEPRKTLADALREDVGATGTHLGCEHGVCGACTVLLDGEAVRSCLLFAAQASGHAVETIEGLTPSDGLSDIQEALQRHHGLQCGFCTPGFVVSIHAFLERVPDPDEIEIHEALAGNLCRCTGYQGLLRAVRDVAAARRAAAGAGWQRSPS